DRRHGSRPLPPLAAAGSGAAAQRARSALTRVPAARAALLAGLWQHGPMTPRSRIAPAVAAAVLGASLAAAARPSFGEAATYALDPEHATVAFLVPHIGFAKVLGQFREVEGSFRFDEAAGELSDIEIVVQTE